MLRKSLLNFMLLCLVFSQSLAHANDGLSQAFQEFRYQTQVEWNQQDQEFYQQAISQLEASIQLALKQGATAAEVQAEALKLVPQRQLRIELSQVSALLAQGEISSELAQSRMLDIVKAQGTRGANWSSELSNDLLASLALAYLLVYVIVTAHEDCSRFGIVLYCY